MKLSEKGLGKLYNSKACYYDPDTEEEVVALSYFEHVFEFEPDDFDGYVVLTVEEAKEAIGDYIDVVAEVVRQRNEPEIKIKHPKSILRLTERIEQAEGKDE